jgi:heme oxygenase
MARVLEQPLSSPQQTLLAETSDLRERFERNPLFARVFADLVDARAYRQVLSAFHAYYRVLETLIQRRREWLNAGPEALENNKTAWLERDLVILETRPGSPAPLAFMPGIHSLEEAIGACFVTEYIAWHSEVTEKHLRLALPRHCLEATHFVSGYGRSREAQWQRFGDWLAESDQAMNRTDIIVQSARSTLAGLDTWLKESIAGL